MAEKLDRCTLVNLLHDSANITHNEELSRMADDLAEMSVGWWIQQKSCGNIPWKTFKKLVNFVITSYRTHKIASAKRFWRQINDPCSNYGIEGYEASVLVAHQAAHHISHYGGSHWAHFILKSCKAQVTDRWLQGLADCNRRHH